MRVRVGDGLITLILVPRRRGPRAPARREAIIASSSLSSLSTDSSVEQRERIAEIRGDCFAEDIEITEAAVERVLGKP